MAWTENLAEIGDELVSALHVAKLATMAELPFPQHLISRVERVETPLVSLEAVRELRDYLSRIEETAILRARDLGSSPEQIAKALGITRQGVHYKLRHILDRREQEQGKVVEIPDLESPPQPRHDGTSS
jgi:DNA-directed RNA polymerase specialized sigma24 family protein